VQVFSSVSILVRSFEVVIFPPMTSTKKTGKKEKKVDVTFFLDVF